MAAMSDNDRADTWREYMKELSSENEPLDVLKADLRTVINEIDDWVDSNQASFNNAISQPMRAALTAPQKARLLLFVVRKRYLTGV